MALAAALLYLGLVLSDFHAWFQQLHDYGSILGGADLLVAGLVYLRPLRSRKSAFAWGVAGGLFALVHPILGAIWAVLTVPPALWQRAYRPVAFTVLGAALTLTPWTIRNLLVLGRLIPVKSNAAYEFYQSQCLQKDGLLRDGTFQSHPYVAETTRREYRTLGEIEFLDRKSTLFWQAVWRDLLDFCDRVAARFLGVTLWYVLFHRGEATSRPWRMFFYRLLSWDCWSSSSRRSRNRCGGPSGWRSVRISSTSPRTLPSATTTATLCRCLGSRHF